MGRGHLSGIVSPVDCSTKPGSPFAAHAACKGRGLQFHLVASGRSASGGGRLHRWDASVQEVWPLQVSMLI
jgi:hypothetical protein